MRNKKIDSKKLIDVTIKYGNKISQKRIGWVLEKLKAPKKNVSFLQKKVSRSKFLTPLNPKNRKGSINREWGVIENVKLS